MTIYLKNKLQHWAIKRFREDLHFWSSAVGSQVLFVRDELCNLVGTGLNMWDAQEIVSVVSTHRSKSKLLPVYRLHRKDLGLTLVLRNNFYNWKMSVISRHPIEANFGNLFLTKPPTDPDYSGDVLCPVYFEGFPDKYIFGYYDTSDKKTWSAEIHGDYNLYSAVFTLMNALGALPERTWNKRDTHKQLLEEQSDRTAESRKKIDLDVARFHFHDEVETDRLEEKWKELSFPDRVKAESDYFDYLISQTD